METFVPRSAPIKETEIKEVRIRSETGSGNPMESSLFKNSDISVNIAVTIVPDKSPHGNAARLLRDAANPQMKYTAIAQKIPKGAVKASGSSEEKQMNVATIKRIIAANIPTLAPKTEADMILLGVSEEERVRIFALPLFFI